MERPVGEGPGRHGKQLLKRGPDQDVSEKLRSCQQLKQLEARPDSVSALLARAELLASLGYWSYQHPGYWAPFVLIGDFR